MQDWKVTTRHGVTRKRSTKRLKHTGNLFRKNLQLKEPTVDFRPKVTKTIGQRKAFYTQRIPEFSCDILVTSRNGERKIMQSIRIKSKPPSRKRKSNQLSQF